MKVSGSVSKKERLVKLGVLICVVGLILVPTRGGSPLPRQDACLNPPPVNISSSQVPTDVCIPTGFSGLPIAFFDDFSWRSFIAVVWPALNGQRGVPDMSKTLADPGPRVFLKPTKRNGKYSITMARPQYLGMNTTRRMLAPPRSALVTWCLHHSRNSATWGRRASETWSDHSWHRILHMSVIRRASTK